MRIRDMNETIEITPEERKIIVQMIEQDFIAIDQEIEGLRENVRRLKADAANIPESEIEEAKMMLSVAKLVRLDLMKPLESIMRTDNGIK